VTVSLTPLEIASGIVLPAPEPLPALPELAPGTTPRSALEAAILPALRRAPCLVSFSGGRDSSAVLATAVTLARRDGLPLPVPVTHRFPAAPGTEEDGWQEQVVAHLRLDDWLRIDPGAELDAVGPVATAVIERHGLLWPCNTYFHAPIFDAAAGGAVLTGIGGDEAFAASAWDRQLAVLGGRVRPQPRDLLRVGFALAPVAVKQRFIRRWMPELFPWLRPAARDAVEAWLARDAASEPLRRSRRLRRLLGSPVLRAGLEGLRTLAADRDAIVVHPLRDERFLAALAALPPAERHRTRSASMEALVGDLLPSEVLRRSTKAHFSEVLWGPQSRALAAGWDGDAVDPEIVDVQRLREMWTSPEPDTQTITLLQSVWWTRARTGAARPRAAMPRTAAA
jgi:asparagine synthetase B (glutamine-hydrolysing)